MIFDALTLASKCTMSDSEAIQILKVCNFFAGSRLIEEEVDGESFLLLTQSDLIQILGFRLGPAVKIVNTILLINNGHNGTNGHGGDIRNHH